MILYSIRSETLSQWRDFRIGVMCLNFGAWTIVRTFGAKKLIELVLVVVLVVVDLYSASCSASNVPWLLNCHILLFFFSLQDCHYNFSSCKTARFWQRFIWQSCSRCYDCHRICDSTAKCDQRKSSAENRAFWTALYNLICIYSHVTVGFKRGVFNFRSVLCVDLVSKVNNV